MSEPAPDKLRDGAVPVSVVIPAYNRSELITRAVTSAAAQRPMVPMEIIVVDDGSSDDTAARAAAAGARVLRHGTNRGEGAARNTGIAAATQPWIALLDSDDEWLPDLLARLWPLRAAHVMVGGGSLHRSAGPFPDRYDGPTGRRPSLLRSPSRLIYPGNFVAASGTMVRRQVVVDVGGYAEGMRGGADMDLWIRVLERGTGVLVPRPVVVYHLHDGQVTADPDLMARSHRAVAQRYADRDWCSPRRLEMWEGLRAYDSIRENLRAGRTRVVLREASALLTSPLRLAGAAGIVVRRLRLRRVLRDPD